MDRSNGYEGIAPEFLARRGSGRSTGIGVNEVRKWARTLPPGAAVIDLGCGPGFPITEVLVAERLSTFGVDAAPSFVQAFRRNLPNTPVVAKPSRIRDSSIALSMASWRGDSCSAFAEDSAASSKGSPDTGAGGRLLFTSPAEPIVGRCDDGLESRSLGAAEYRRTCQQLVSRSRVNMRMKAKPLFRCVQGRAFFSQSWTQPGSDPF